MLQSNHFVKVKFNLFIVKFSEDNHFRFQLDSSLYLILIKNKVNNINNDSVHLKQRQFILIHKSNLTLATELCIYTASFSLKRNIKLLIFSVR